MKQKVRRYKLKRELGLFTTTLYGVGIILGAGIYALIGVGAGIAGNALWLAFIIAAFIASFTGLSYAELSSMYPKEAAEYVYTKHAFKKSFLAFIVSWILVLAGMVSAATVALGFGGYFSDLFGGAPVFIAAVLLVLLSLLNFWGIKESARFNVIATLIEVSGLILVILIGLYVFAIAKTAAIGDLSAFWQLPAAGYYGIVAAAALIFFAYIGFEDLVNISEEVKNARKTVPMAVILSIAITTIIYILVAVSAVGVVGAQQLAASPAPLKEVAAQGLGAEAGVIMAFIALFATSNTVLIILIVLSRILYGMACQQSIPGVCARIHSTRRTPYISVFLVMALSLAALAIGGIKTIALLTNIGIFIVYIFINFDLIAMRITKPDFERPFKSPSIGNVPILAWLGVLTAGAMLFYFEPMLWLYELLIVAAGIGVWALMRKIKS